MTPRLLGVPVLAYLGVIAAFLMLFSFEPFLWLLEAVVIGIGIAIFLLNKRQQKKTQRFKA